MIDFSDQKKHLKQQFENLYSIAKQTDASFLGAVAAQKAAGAPAPVAAPVAEAAAPAAVVAEAAAPEAAAEPAAAAPEAGTEANETPAAE